MTGPERRRSPRITIERLTYIQVEPNNGGIVLNISSEGLSFQSVAPVGQNKVLRFSLLEHKRSIDACGELIWTDEIRKSGGLRFTGLSSEARGQICDWLSHIDLEQDKAAKSVEEDKGSIPVVAPLIGENKYSSVVEYPSVVARLDEHKASRGKYSVLSSFRPLRTWLWGREGHSGDSLSKVSASMKPSGFSAGFATGLLISVLGASICLLFYAHRLEFGESLVHLGERLGGHREVLTQNLFRTPQMVAPTLALPTQKPVTSTPAKPPGSQSVRQEVPVQPVVRAYKPERLKANRPATDMTVSQRGGDGTQHIRVANTEHTALAPPDTALRAPALSPPKFLFNKIDAVPQPGLATTIGVKPSGFSLEMYFDLGKFKDKLTAHNLRDRVAQLGLRTAVLERKIFWKTSYQVLVGPYSSEEDESRIKNNLVSNGYKPRPFERGSRDFVFASQLSLNGSRVPVGDLTIRWESYVADAKVQFAKDRDVVATAHGRWIKCPQKYLRDEYVYIKNADGSKTLLEVHFSGLNRALVFRNSS